MECTYSILFKIIAKGPHKNHMQMLLWGLKFGYAAVNALLMKRLNRDNLDKKASFDLFDRQ